MRYGWTDMLSYRDTTAHQKKLVKTMIVFLLVRDEASCEDVIDMKEGNVRRGEGNLSRRRGGKHVQRPRHVRRVIRIRILLQRRVPFTILVSGYRRS